MRHDRRHRPARPRRTASAVLCVTTAALLLSGCADGGGDEANTADTVYARRVISHHAQTLALLDLTLGRDGLDPRLGAFADDARTDLFAEVSRTEKRLTAWDEKVPKTALEHTHDDSVTYDTSVAGVLSNDQMDTLAQTRGTAFEQAWLRELIAHEQGAVELADEAASKGSNAAAVAAARKDEQVHEDRISALEKLVAP